MHCFRGSCFQAIRVLYSVGEKCGYLLKYKKYQMDYTEINCKRNLKMVEKAIKKSECIVQMYRPSKVRKLNFNE